MALPQSNIGPGAQPQLTIDAKGTIRVIFGKAGEIHYSFSNDNGKSFSEPVVIAQVKDMHLGMGRGPQLATSRDFSLVTAMDKEGNIHSFRLAHKSGKWEKIQHVNDKPGSAPEGLMSVAADNSNNFFAVWLDLREDRKNNICFATYNAKAGWTPNVFVYKSPSSHVCECCKPSIAVRDKHVVIMFRNWLLGSRDLYVVTSEDRGKTFDKAQKLGNGTWPLKGCPMDGGGLTIDSNDQIHTAWQRDGQVYYAQPGQPEQKIGEGRGVGLSGDIITWQSGSDLLYQKINESAKKIGTGTAPRLHEFADGRILAVWENNNQILYGIY